MTVLETLTQLAIGSPKLIPVSDWFDPELHAWVHVMDKDMTMQDDLVCQVADAKTLDYFNRPYCVEHNLPRAIWFQLRLTDAMQLPTQP